MYNMFHKIQQCYMDEPIENILQYVQFMMDFFIYFSILDGCPDSTNDVLIKSRVTTDNPIGWNKVLKELGYYYIKDGQIFYREDEFMKELEYYILKNEHARIERTVLGHNLIHTLKTNIPHSIEDLINKSIEGTL